MLTIYACETQQHDAHSIYCAAIPISPLLDLPSSQPETLPLLVTDSPPQPLITITRLWIYELVSLGYPSGESRSILQLSCTMPSSPKYEGSNLALLRDLMAMKTQDLWKSCLLSPVCQRE